MFLTRQLCEFTEMMELDEGGSSPHSLFLWIDTTQIYFTAVVQHQSESIEALLGSVIPG